MKPNGSIGSATRGNIWGNDARESEFSVFWMGRVSWGKEPLRSNGGSGRQYPVGNNRDASGNAFCDHAGIVLKVAKLDAKRFLLRVVNIDYCKRRMSGRAFRAVRF